MPGEPPATWMTPHSPHGILANVSGDTRAASGLTRWARAAAGFVPRHARARGDDCDVTLRTPGAASATCKVSALPLLQLPCPSHNSPISHSGGALPCLLFGNLGHSVPLNVTAASGPPSPPTCGDPTGETGDRLLCQQGRVAPRYLH